MPKLLFFAPCLQVLVSPQNPALLSLISVIDHVDVAVQVGIRPPADAVVPQSWAVVAAWSLDAEEVGKVFEQRLQVLQPNGNHVLESHLTFAPATRSHKTLTHFPVMPIGQEGEQTLRVSIRAAGTKNWKSVGTYPVTVAYDMHAIELVSPSEEGA
jgi:hypothetical protein